MEGDLLEFSLVREYGTFYSFFKFSVRNIGLVAFNKWET